MQGGDDAKIRTAVGELENQPSLRHTLSPGADVGDEVC